VDAEQRRFTAEELRDLDQRALAVAGGFVAAVTTEALARPTPCEGWTLDVLLRHMVSHNHGFAAAARGEPAQRTVWEDATLDPDPYGAYRASADEVVAAFADDGVLGRKLDIYSYGVFSAPVAFGMHFVDFLVHGWDVARSVGAVGVIDDDLSEAALAVALRWPYHRPDKAFGVKVDVPDDAPAHQRLVAYLGRPPDWQPPA
jgi:uncharacterized protein (TIGR03086 family)